MHGTEEEKTKLFLISKPILSDILLSPARSCQLNLLKEYQLWEPSAQIPEPTEIFLIQINITGIKWITVFILVVKYILLTQYVNKIWYILDLAHWYLSLCLSLHNKRFGLRIYSFLLSFLNYKIVNLFNNIWDICGEMYKLHIIKSKEMRWWEAINLETKLESFIWR